jgi:predicted Zn-dependent protease
MIKVVGILKSQEEFDKQLAKEEGREPRAYHGLFSTHPANDLRLQEVIQAADKFKTAETKKGERFMTMMDGLVLGDREEDGIIRKNHFYHKQLGITLSFPENWKIDNLPDRLVSSPKSKDAIIQVTLRDLNRRQTPKQFLQAQFKKGLKQGISIQTYDYQGYSAIVKTNTPFGQLDTRVGVIFKDKQVYQIFAAAKDETLLRQYDDAFVDTISSLRALKDSEIKLATPRKLKVITAKQGDTFAKLAQKSPLTSHAEDQLRLLNGLYPDGEPTPGQSIKIVQ